VERSNFVWASCDLKRWGGGRLGGNVDQFKQQINVT